MEYLVHCVLTYLSVPSSCSGSRLDALVGLVLHPYCLSRQRSHNCRSLGLWLLLLFCEGHWPEQQGQCGHPMPHPCSCLSNRISSRCLERKRICRHWKSEIKLYILLQVIEIIAKLLNFFFLWKTVNLYIVHSKSTLTTTATLLLNCYHALTPCEPFSNVWTARDLRLVWVNPDCPERSIWSATAWNKQFPSLGISFLNWRPELRICLSNRLSFSLRALFSAIDCCKATFISRKNRWIEPIRKD